MLAATSVDQSGLNFIYFLAAVGGLYLLVGVVKMGWRIIKAILPRKNLIQRYGSNTWAVVTGGSDGIGLGFCQELASQGFNIVMMARNREKMQAALSKLQQQNRGILTKLIVADFGQSSQKQFFSRIKKELDGLQISILVNNVGISNIGRFHEIEEDKIMQQITVNVVPMTLMTRILLPNMLTRANRSAIINISSVAGQNPLPYIATYSATKAYNDFFSQSIQIQVSNKIDVLSVRPMYVESNMSKMEKSLTVASRNQCAQASLSYLGYDYQTNGYFIHRVMSYFTSLMPSPLLRCVAQSQSRKVMERQNKN